MRRIGTVSLAALSLCALGTLESTAASATEGALPQQGTKVFKIAGQGGSVVLETTRGETITCKELSGEGKYLTNSDQHATGAMTFKGCTAIGFTATTLGEASGTIKSKVLFLICLVAPKTLLFGLLILPEATEHVEITAIKQLLLLKGAYIAHNLSGNRAKEFLFDLEGSKGVQKIATECEINGAEFEHTLESSVDTKEDVGTSITAKFVLKYETEVELEDT